MKLKDYLFADLILPALSVEKKSDLFTVLVKFLKRNHPDVKYSKTRKILIAQEVASCSYAGNGIAIPNAVVDGIDRTTIIVAKIPDGLEYDSFDDESVYIVFLILSPPRNISEHIRLVARLARFACHRDFCDALIKCSTASDLIEKLICEDAHYD
jgi:mannitol/fructose-specific phosphotransferase system IIA component (Ntr-type)